MKKEFTTQDMLDFVKHYDGKDEKDCFDTFEEELIKYLELMNTEKSNTENTSNELYTLLCPVDLFRYFLRKNYKEIKMTNEECDGLGEDFYKYLRALNLTEDQKKNILPKNTFDVILNADHPLRTNGFPPAYVLHFAEYVEKEKQKALAEGYNHNVA